MVRRPVGASATAIFGVALAPLPSPVVAQSAPVTITTLVEAADISGLAVSPDGKRIAYRVVRGSLAQDKMVVDWFVAPVHGHGPSRWLASGGEALFSHAGSIVPETPVWSPDSQTLFFRRRADRSLQIWGARIGETAKPLTDDPADIVAYKLAEDGRSIVYRVGATRQDIRRASGEIYDDGLLIDATTDLAQPVAGGLVIDGERVMQRYTGKWFERVPLLSETPLTTKSIALEGASVTIAAAPATRGVARREAGQVSSQLFLDTADGRSDACPSTACGANPVGGAWMEGTHELLVTTGDVKGRVQLRLWRAGDTRSRLVVDQVGTLDGGPAPLPAPCATASSRIFCVAASAASPPKLVAIEIESGRQKIVDDPNASLRRAISSAARTLDWQAGGFSFHGELLQPKDAHEPVPLVLSYYRCPGFLKGGFGEALPVQPLVEAGIAVLCIDAARVPGKYFAPDHYAAALPGIAAVIDRLARDGTIDGNRVGMWGFSFGSETTQYVMRHSTLLKAVSLASLQITESYFWPNALPGRDMSKVIKNSFGLGWPDHEPESWSMISPSRNTATLNAPVLIQSAEDEIRWMGEFLSSAARDGKPVEMHAFADEAHALMRPRHKRAALERNLDWFRFWLNNERDPAPAKAAQYERWARLASMGAAKPLDRPNP